MEEDFIKIKVLLNRNNVKYKIQEHLPVHTSEDAARIRNVDIKSGAKSMIVKADNNFYNFVVSAAKKLDWKKINLLLKTKKSRLASPEEVLKVMNCEIGSVPPFGNIHNLKVYCDPSLLENEFIDFNAGLLTASIRMKSKDWVKIVVPEVVDFGK